MISRTTTNLTEAQRIERALDLLVTTALDARSPWRPQHEGGRTLGSVLTEYLAATPAQTAANALLDNPVGEALREAISTLGTRLHELGGMKLMSEVLDRVALTDPSREDVRTGLLDHRWSGIGDWFA